MLEDIMEELLTLLSHIKEDVDFKNSVNLVEDGVLDSLEIVAIIDGVEKHLRFHLILMISILAISSQLLLFGI